MSDDIQARGDRVLRFVERSPTGSAIDDLRSLTDQGWNPRELLWRLVGNDEMAAAAAFVAAEATPASIAPHVDIVAAITDHPNARVRRGTIEALLRQPSSPLRDAALLSASTSDETAAGEAASWDEPRATRAQTALRGAPIRRTVGPLATPVDQVERKVASDVLQYGWHVVLVRSGGDDHRAEGQVTMSPTAREAYDSEFAYTVGLEYTFGHPEIVLVGPWRHTQAYLNTVGEMIAEGDEFAPGDRTGELLEGFDVRFDEISEAVATELLTWVGWATNRTSIRAVQLVLPDTTGRFPEAPGYLGYAQPRLVSRG